MLKMANTMDTSTFLSSNQKGHKNKLLKCVFVFNLDQYYTKCFNDFNLSTITTKLKEYALLNLIRNVQVNVPFVKCKSMSFTGLYVHLYKFVPGDDFYIFLMTRNCIHLTFHCLSDNNLGNQLYLFSYNPLTVSKWARAMMHIN